MKVYLVRSSWTERGKPQFTIMATDDETEAQEYMADEATIIGTTIQCKTVEVDFDQP